MSVFFLRIASNYLDLSRDGCELLPKRSVQHQIDALFLNASQLGNRSETMLNGDEEGNARTPIGKGRNLDASKDMQQALKIERSRVDRLPIPLIGSGPFQALLKHGSGIYQCKKQGFYSVHPRLLTSFSSTQQRCAVSHPLHEYGDTRGGVNGNNSADSLHPSGIISARCRLWRKPQHSPDNSEREGQCRAYDDSRWNRSHSRNAATATVH